MDIQKDIRDHVLAALPYDPSVRTELEAKSATDLLIIYFNWCNRLIPAQPRTVHRSEALNKNPLAATLKRDLDILISKIERGDDLTPHLSKRIDIGYESKPGSKFNRRRDLDLMLNDWQVHHLHVSSVMEPDGRFVKRDGPLLFAALPPDAAYLIDIFGHGDWTREAIMNILIEEWPNSGFVHELKGIVGVSHTPSEKERTSLRNAGFSSPFIEHNGKVYMIGIGGITSAGRAVYATTQAQRTLKAARNFEDYIAVRPNYIADTLKENGVQPPAVPDLHLYLTNDGAPGILERHTKVLFRLF